MKWTLAGPDAKSLACDALVVFEFEGEKRAELADALPNAEFREIPGTHMSSITEPEFGEAIAAFLSA